MSQSASQSSSGNVIFGDDKGYIVWIVVGVVVIVGVWLFKRK